MVDVLGPPAMVAAPPGGGSAFERLLADVPAFGLGPADNAMRTVPRPDGS
jgi:hypothetical protein